MKYEVFLRGSKTFRSFRVESPFPLRIGSRILVKKGNEEHLAYVVREGGNGESVRFVGVLDEILDPERVELALWISSNYVSPPGIVLDLSFPRDLDSYIEERIVSTSDLVPVEELPKDEFIELHGENTLENMLASGYVKIERKFKLPDIRLDPNETVRLRVDLVKIAGLDLKRSELEVVERLLLEDEIRMGDLPEGVVRSLLKRGILELGYGSRESRLELNEDQKEALKNLEKDVNLLFGPTGSGKTEVYIEAIRGKKALYLVPEVALIPQTVRRIRARLPSAELAVYHGYLSSAKKSHSWIRTVRGDVDVLIGTRSALFVPRRWDIIVVDEEHDESYYQREGVVYDAVETALKLAQLYSIPVILGSATPRIRHFYLAKNRTYNFVRLVKRHAAVMPNVELIDLKKSEKHGSFAKKVLDRISETLESRKKVLVFVRRKGFSRVICQRCGFTPKCPNCDVSLVYHRKRGEFVCHVCGFSVRAFDTCPVCSEPLKLVGTGTEKVESELKRYFPEARVGRADRETLSRPDRIVRVLDALAKGELDVLVGTRMISKGLDIPGIGLMVVMDLDGILAIPDFESRIRVFREIVQAVGRAGRDTKARAVVQFYELDEDILRSVSEHDVERFYDSEIERREELGYPPFKHIVHVVKSSRIASGAANEIHHIASELEKMGEEVLGPSEHPVFKSRGFYRYHLLVKTDNLEKTLEHLREILKHVKRGCKIFVDPPGLFTY